MSSVMNHANAAASDRDFSLIDALREGDDRAFEVLVREHTPRMLATAMRMLHCESEANDAVQDAFISAFKALGTFNGASTLSTWLHRIVVNASLMRLRKKRSRNECSIEELLPSFHDDGHRRSVQIGWTMPSPTDLEQSELRTVLACAIEQLPHDYRTILMLRDVESLSTAEAAAVLGIKDCTVKVRLHRARMALRTLLERSTAVSSRMPDSMIR